MKIHPRFWATVYIIVCLCVLIAEAKLADIHESDRAQRESIMRQTIEALEIRNTRLSAQVELGQAAIAELPLILRDENNVPVGRPRR